MSKWIFLKSLQNQYLWIDSNYFATFIAIIGKNIFVAFYAIWMIISQNVTMTGKRIITMMTKHFFLVECSRVSVGCLLVLSSLGLYTENILKVESLIFHILKNITINRKENQMWKYQIYLFSFLFLTYFRSSVWM